MADADERRILQRVLDDPDDVEARIAAAYFCDAHKSEVEAVVHYDAAWRLGVPTSVRRDFMLGYGSTLKNVGRLAESERLLRLAIDENPDDFALAVFLALTLHAAGRSDDAIARLLDVLIAIDEHGNAGIAHYRRALKFYSDELRRR